MKIYFTRDELRTEWLEKFPIDPDFEFNCVAGYVETKNGFIEWKYYEVTR